MSCSRPARIRRTSREPERPRRAGRRGPRLPVGPPPRDRVGAATSGRGASRASSCARASGSKDLSPTTTGSRAVGVGVADGDPVTGDVVVDALGRYRCAPGMAAGARARPRNAAPIYYCRYFRLVDGVEHLEGGPADPLNPRGDLGYMGFNTFRGRQPHVRGDRAVPVLGSRAARAARRERVDGGLRRDAAARRHDVARLRHPDHGRDADGRAHEHRPDGRSGRGVASWRSGTRCVTPTRRSRGACRSAWPTRSAVARASTRGA